MSLDTYMQAIDQAKLTLTLKHSTYKFPNCFLQLACIGAGMVTAIDSSLGTLGDEIPVQDESACCDLCIEGPTCVKWTFNATSLGCQLWYFGVDFWNGTEDTAITSGVLGKFLQSDVGHFTLKDKSEQCLPPPPSTSPHPHSPPPHTPIHHTPLHYTTLPSPSF